MQRTEVGGDPPLHQDQTNSESRKSGHLRWRGQRSQDSQAIGVGIKATPTNLEDEQNPTDVSQLSYSRRCQGSLSRPV